MKESINPRIKPLDQITAADESVCGSKAYNCARLRQAGFPVPDGIVVLATATDEDVAEIGTHPWFDRLSVAELFAVRSSGIGEDGGQQSFAGIHQTFLNVATRDLSRAVAECQASGCSHQALEYRRANRMSTDVIQMGVLIQRMIQPVAAGVAFTMNPINGSRSEVVINSSWGVGEALVSGQVDPDEFVISKQDGELIWSRIGEKGRHDNSPVFSLSIDQVSQLSRMLMGIEKHYGAPQDVEWCHDGRDFWIVQSRPITTASEQTDEVTWTRANLVEVLPDMTSPQALSAFEDLLNRAERQYVGKLLAPEHLLGPMFKSFCGRLYLNLSQTLRGCALGGLSPADVLRSMGHSEAIAEEKPPRISIRERLSCIPDLVRIVRKQLRAAHIIQDHEVRTRRHLSRFSADPRRLSDKELWSALEDWFQNAPDWMQAVLLLAGVSAYEAPVRKVCEKAGFSFEQLVYPQLAAGERSVSAQQAFDLLALAETARRDPAVVRFLSDRDSDLTEMRAALSGSAFRAEFDRFLQAYGHRGRYESDWSLPRYSEDPTPLLLAVRAHIEDASVKSIAEIVSRQEREAAHAWAAFENRLSAWQRRMTLPRIRRSIQKIKQYYVWRERVRSDMVRVIAAARQWHLVLADRFVERGWLDHQEEYFLLHLGEIARVIKGETAPETLRTAVAQRTAETARYRTIQMPLLMRESELPRLIRTSGVSSRSDDESQLSGQPVSGGCVEAEVVVVRDPADFGRMKPGAILVAPATDPSWTPLFTLASGVIVEIGGVLSHASTIAREYGLPAIANVKHATKRLQTGERVRLDAIQGVVHRLQHKPA